MSKEYEARVTSENSGRRSLLAVGIKFPILAVLSALIIAPLFWTTVSGSEENGALVELADTKWQTAVHALEARIKECDALAAKASITPEQIPHLELTGEEWSVALLHLSRVARYRCEGEALWGRAVIAFNRLQIIGDYYGESLMSGSAYDLETLCCGAWKSELRVELEYMEINEDLRRALEATEALKSPFDPLQAISALRIVK